MDRQLSIGMIGTGYVGLVSAACFAELGLTVNCVDKNEEKLKLLNSGQVPIYEPGLEELVSRNIACGRLFFTNNLLQAVVKSDVIFIAVGTPTSPVDQSPDLTYINAVAKELAVLLQPETHKTIVLKSTVPVGTCRQFAELVRTLNPNANFDMISNPEFLREGSAVQDFMNPDRIVIGLENKKSMATIAQLYTMLACKGVPIAYTDLETSETIKYAANCFLATKIAFINELANLCEKTGANIEQVAYGIGLDRRIGEKYLQVGPGYGGSCFPKDTLALVHSARLVDEPLSIVEAVVLSNENRKLQMVNKIVNACGGSVLNKKLAILGVAFKANTDDIRDSAAIPIIQGLQKLGAVITACDPIAQANAEKVLNIDWASDVYDATKGKDALIIATEWDGFKDLDLNIIKSNLAAFNPVIVDLRNLYNPQVVAEYGIHYTSVGRPCFPILEKIPVEPVTVLV